MATTITFRRGTADPTQASGLTLGEPAFNTTLNTFFIGKGTGVTAAWVGAGICGASGGIAAGITYQVPTMAAVKDYVINTATGVSSLNNLTGAVTISGGTNIGVTAAGSSITITGYGVSAAQANTFTAVQTFNSGVTFASTIDVTGNAKFNGNVNFGDAAADVMTVTGGMTVGSSLDVTGNAKFNGNVTVGDAASDVLTVVAGTTLAITDHSGVARFASGVTVSGRLDAASVLDVVGGATFESTTDHAGAARFASTITSTGAVTANGGLTASTLDVSGTARTTGDVTVGATLTVNGNFFVSGTVTTVNRTDLNIDDKTITMGRTLASDTLADGGGLSLSGTAARTWTWSNTRSSWESNQGVNVATGYGYGISGASVLTATALGSSVVSSSLTSVGTIATGVWQATAVGATYGGTGRTSYTIGDVLYANGTSSLTVLGASTAGRLLSSTGAGTAPEYKQLLIRDADAVSVSSESTGTGTLIMTIQNASTTVKGLAKFDPANFTVSGLSASVTAIDGGSF
jgi:hypothetical protein